MALESTLPECYREVVRTLMTWLCILVSFSQPVCGAYLPPLFSSADLNVLLNIPHM